MKSTGPMLKTLAAIGVGMTLLGALPSGHADGRWFSGVARTRMETAFGRPADPAKARRIVRVDVSDQMRYTPGQLSVKQGDVIRFIVANKGAVPHEMVLGTMEELARQAQLTRGHADAAHDGPHIARVAPGKTGEFGWQFTRTGEFYYACLIPGHFQKWAVGKVSVKPGSAGEKS
ncbi:MAG: hypothetical protein A3G81_25200 [Betaproteobacteria bacterium RIFCSPLOWO2_12_FULL_65_14]|nr:MAG: hypothetical protein A3G81_25200 [Betaproteobacteria bacterium RIFCSPLOWO2_12_FULL_65_14]